MTPAIAGIAADLAGSFLLTRLMESMLFGVSAGDPLTLLPAPAIVLATAAVATNLPSRRAARVDPAVAFRTAV